MASERAWLTLTCTSDGSIVQVLRDDLGATNGAARFADLVDAGSKSKAENFLAEALAQSSVAGWQMNATRGDRAKPMFFAAVACGETLLVIAVSELTQGMSNELYEELSRLNNELINRERELARKSAALERVSAEKSRVVAILAHDLRNPLTIITAYADLLKLDAAVGGEHLDFVEEIARTSRFMTELVEEMLDSSRLESGQVQLDLQEIDLVKAAQHAATTNSIRAARKEITVAFDPQAGAAPIRADAVKLRQIINNLVVNAIKFSPARTTVIIRVRREADRALLEVEDRGIGMPKEKLDLIFEPFRTLVPAGTADEVSTGLGLTIVKQLSEMHGATIHVESEAGRGSLFRVSFPLSA